MKLCHGENHPTRKLTEDNVREIRKLRAQGLKQYAIAKMFNIGKDQISKIVNNKAWQHVEG